MAYNGNNYSRSNGYSDNRNNDRRYQDKNKKEESGRN